MRAVICNEFGPPEMLRIGDVAEPSPGPGQVLVAVRAAGISFADTLMIRNLHQNKHALPFVPGMEVAGIVEAAGPGVDRSWVGRRVMALVYDGGYAEYAVALAEDVFALPDAVGFETAAAIASVYLTAHAALRWEARLQPDETLLVLGAAGGVGLAALEIGRVLGARVIAAVGSQEKAAIALGHGADAVIDYSAEELKTRVSDATGGRGVNVVFDPVGGSIYESAFASLDWGGRYLVIGFAGGAIPQIPANRLLVKNRAALGFALMYYRRQRNAKLRESAAEIFRMLDGGELRPAISSIPSLDEVPEGLSRLMSRSVAGKLVAAVHPGKRSL